MKPATIPARVVRAIALPVEVWLLTGALSLPGVALTHALLAPPIVTPAVAAPGKDQSRHAVGLLEAVAVPFLDFDVPNIDASLYAPMEVKPVAPVIYRKDDARPKAKGKRSEIEGMQLASLVPITNDDDVAELKTESVTLRTPLGTDIKTNVSLDRISPELPAFLRKVQAECGPVTVISGHRKTGVPGTCHARGQALDYQIEDHACALRVAQSFRGGHSTDYLGVQRIRRGMPAHFHVSVCPMEMGARFAHRVGSARSKRHAKRHSGHGKRYARRVRGHG